MKPTQQPDINPASARMTAALALMIRRVRRLILLRGLSLVILAWLTGLAVAMAVDGYWVIYSPLARWSLALVTYGPAAAVAVWALLRPLSQTLTPAGLARAIERRHPELHERVSSAVELMATFDAPDQRGSAALIRALGETAAADISRVDPRVEISIRRVARYLTLSASALFIVIVAGLIWPTTAGRLALRSALPILNLPNIHAGDLTVEPGDSVALLGERMRIVLRSTQPGLSDAQVIVEQSDSQRQVLSMSRLGERDGDGSRFSAVTEPLVDGFVYRVRTGGAVTQAYKVMVTPRPEVTHFDVTYEYPAYTQREPTRMRVVNGAIRAVAGTQVTVRATFNKPIQTLALHVDGKPITGDDNKSITIQQPEPDIAVLRMQLEPGNQSTWRLEAVDAHGFTGSTGEYLLEAVADAMPNVVITNPTEEQLKLSATDRLMLHYTIDDDFGVDLAGLILEADGQPLPIRTLALTGSTVAANRALSGQIAIDFSDLPQERTRRLALQLRARDNRSAALGGPQVGTSRILLVDFDGNAKPHQVQVLDQYTQRLRTAMVAASAEIAKARGSITKLDQAIKRPTDEKAILDSTRQALTAVEQIDQAMEAVDTTMRDSFYDGLRQPLRASVGAPVVKAAEAIAQVPVADHRDMREQITASAMADLERADDALKSMTARLDEMQNALTQAVAMRDLAERQAELAAALDPNRREEPVTASISSPEVARALNANAPAETQSTAVAVPSADDTVENEMLAELQRQQEQLVDDLAAVIQQMPDANKAAVAQTREQIERLKVEAEALRDRHRELTAQTDEDQRMADQWKVAAEGLEAQFDALSGARRELLLPRTSVPLGEIAADLEAGRLRDAAEKIDTVADDLENQIERLEREKQTEALAEQVSGLMAESAAPMYRLAAHAAEPGQAPVDEADRQALEAMASQLDAIAEASKQATPLARQAMALQNPAEDIRAALATDANARDTQPDAAQTAREKAARLEAAMRAAARAAKADRLAERVEVVADEIKTMEDVLRRANDLSQRMATAIDPWQEALNTAAAKLAKQEQTARQRQEALAAETQALAEEARSNPVTAAAPMDAVREALMPQSGRLTNDQPPSLAAEARRAEAAAEKARRAAEAIEASMAQTQDRADSALQRAREGVDAVSDATDKDMQREAQWRLEEAEEQRERDQKRVEEAAATAQRLKRLAEVLDEVASEHREIDAQLGEIADDTRHLSEAEALSQQAKQRAQAAERAAQRLAPVQDQLEQQQKQMLADMGDTPARDARGVAQIEKEKAMPAASESMLELASAADDLARRQDALTQAIAELSNNQEQLRSQPADAGKSEATELSTSNEESAASPPGAAAPSTSEPAASPPAGASPAATPQAERRLHEDVQSNEQATAELANAQRELGQEARQLKERAAVLAADTKPTLMPQPEQSMDRAARALESAATPEALAAAQQASQQQAALAEAMAQRAAAMPPDQRMAAAPPQAPSTPSPSPTSPPSSPSPSDPASPQAPSTPPQSAASPPSPSTPSPSPNSPPSSPSPSDPASPQSPSTPSQTPATPPGSEFPDMALPPAQQAALDRKSTKPEFTGEKLIPETEVIPNVGVDEDGMKWNLGHANERPEQQLPKDFDLGNPPVLDNPQMPFNFAGAPDVPVPPVPAAPKKEAMSGPVPYSDPVSMAAPVTELPKIIMPDRFPQTFAGEFSDAPIQPPPPEKSSSLAPAPRLTKSNLDDARKEFAELSAIHIDDAPNSSDMGGQAVEEMPSEMLFQPGAQYSRGAPGQSSMPGMELGQLSQAENQDQQSPSPAQTPMPSAGGSGGGESNESPPSQSSSPKPPSPPSGSPPGKPSSSSDSSSGSSSGSQSGSASQPAASPGQQQASPPPASPGQPGSPSQPSAMQPGNMANGAPADPSMQGTEPSQGPAAFPSPMNAGTEAQQLRELKDNLSLQPHSTASLPNNGTWRDAAPGEAIPAESVRQLAGQLQQVNRLAPRLLEHAKAPPTASPELGSISDASVAQLLPQLASQAQALSQTYAGPAVDVSTVPADQMALAEALQYARRVALTGDPRDAEAAAMRMAWTASEARQRAEAMGLRIELRPATRAGDDQISEAELRRMGVPVSDWLRLPGELRSEVLQARPVGGPEGYRTLIQRYFSDVARDGENDGH